MGISQKDRDILRALAAEYAEIAALPAQEEKRGLWRALNGLKPKRPMVMIDQICWNELAAEELMQLRCEDAECRRHEEVLRQKLYQWKHFPVDMVAEPYFLVPKAIENSRFGIEVREEQLVTDPTNSVVAHKYLDILQTDEDLDKISIPAIRHNEAETARRVAKAEELFGGLLPVYAEGMDVPVNIWDPISTFKGVENALYALVDEPEFVHRLVARMVWSYTGMLDQLEAQGLLPAHQTLVHCTGAYADELPKLGFDPAKPRTRDIWTFGLAQMFSTVSAEMHQEFEFDYVNPLFERFGLVYYGCCDPMDYKMAYAEKIPNLRKVSMSPWVDLRRGAEAIHGRFVYSRKPNPAFLATDCFDEQLVRKDLEDVRAVCEETGCPLEFILKDISTIRYDPARLARWAEIAMDVAYGK